MIIKSTGEDFEYHWGFVDYRDKIIMDLGADFGSTAECFLQKGALKVVCVEGNEQYYINLESYCQTTNGKAVPIKNGLIVQEL